MNGVGKKYFPSPNFFFRLFNRHPFVEVQGEEIKLPISEELRGIDELSLVDKKSNFIVVNSDESRFELSDTIDGGEF